MTLTVGQEHRRDLIRQQDKINGIDFAQAGEDRQTLVVVFFKDPPEGLWPANVRVTGPAGRPAAVRFIELVQPGDPDLESGMLVRLAHPATAGPYRIRLVGVDDIDPLYAEAEVVFPPGPGAAGEAMDCAAGPAPSALASPPPELNYLSKDYTSFRQLILDRLATTLPGWTERHAPDIGIMVAEVMAFAGDRLSYMQDAVATEAYIGTARRRISVRRHARLVDYAMHEGCNARVLVAVNPPADISLPASSLQVVLAAAPGVDPMQGPVFAPALRGAVNLRKAHMEIAFHTWGDADCVLDEGSVSAFLLDRWADEKSEEDPATRPRVLALAAGDFLLLEQAKGPLSGLAADADPTLRHVVRLTAIEPHYDALMHHPIVRVAWSVEDALPFPLTLSATIDGKPVAHIGVARGNLLLMDHGRAIERSGLTAGANGPGVTLALSLPDPDLIYRDPPPAGASAVRSLRQNPAQALPAILSLTSPDPQAEAADAGEPLTWTAQPDLLASGPDDAHFVVEMDDDRVARLRFGDGLTGLAPGTVPFTVTYRVGALGDGSVGAERLTGLILNGVASPDYAVSNPLASLPGTAPESVQRVRLLAPNAFRNTLRRAITADDYIALAEQDARVQRAACRLLPLGPRRLAQVFVDGKGGETPSPALLADLQAALDACRAIGHDVEVEAGVLTPLVLTVAITVMDGYLRAHVAAAVRQALGSGAAQNGQAALFNPDNMTFGAVIHTSPILAAVCAIAGVKQARIVNLARQFDSLGQSVTDGALTLGPFEIPVLDNDPTRPDRGRLSLKLQGGR